MWHMLLDRPNCTGQVCPRAGQSVPGVGLPTAECGRDREGWRNFPKGTRLDALRKRPGLVLRRRGIASEYPRNDVRTGSTGGDVAVKTIDLNLIHVHNPAMHPLGRTTNAIAESRTCRPSAQRADTVLWLDRESM